MLNKTQLLQATHRLAEAEPLMRRALAISEASYGADHPKVATVLNNLAQLLQATHRLAEAEPLMRRALVVFIGSLGMEHPSSRSAAGNYIRLLQAMGRTEDEIKRLCKRQASEISDIRWEFDTQQLVKGLEKACRAAPD